MRVQERVPCEDDVLANMELCARVRRPLDGAEKYPSFRFPVPRNLSSVSGKRRLVGARGFDPAIAVLEDVIALGFQGDVAKARNQVAAR